MALSDLSDPVLITVAAGGSALGNCGGPNPLPGCGGVRTQKHRINQARLNPLYTNMVLEDNDAIWRLVTVVAGDT